MKMFVEGYCCCCNGLMKLKTEVTEEGVRRLGAGFPPVDIFYVLGVLFSCIFARTFRGAVEIFVFDFNWMKFYLIHEAYCCYLVELLGVISCYCAKIYCRTWSSPGFS